VNLTEGQLLLAGWLGVASLVTFLLFGYDKWQASHRGGRVAESTLWLASAFGGWPGGLAGMMVFRHKSAKGSFQLKFAAAFVVWAALLWAGWQLSEKLSGSRVSAGLETGSGCDSAEVFGRTAARSPRLQENDGECEPCG
jgi:uncharacterized membrane protein YsdA (DUF1294 family)